MTAIRFLHDTAHYANKLCLMIPYIILVWLINNRYHKKRENILSSCFIYKQVTFAIIFIKNDS